MFPKQKFHYTYRPFAKSNYPHAFAIWARSQESADILARHHIMESGFSDRIDTLNRVIAVPSVFAL